MPDVPTNVLDIHRRGTLPLLGLCMSLWIKEAAGDACDINNPL